MQTNKSNKMSNQSDKPEKYQYVFEDEETISIWKYDRRKSNSVCEVEIKWKKIPVVQKSLKMKDYIKK